MMRVLLSLSLFFSAAYSWAGINFDGNSSVNIKKMIANVEVPCVKADSKVNVKEWTVMVYVNAKNNLDRYGLKDLNEMEMVGSSDKVNIIAELGRTKHYSDDWTGCKRYYIKKDNNKNKITSPELDYMPECDMGDWKHLVDFAKWAMAKYPAKKYVLVVWNHGSGWNKDSMFEHVRGISYDDETNNHITTPQLGMALKEIGKVNIFAMDACLMHMIEVDYEIKDYADYIVASEETEPGDGYTYDTWLGPLVKKPAMDARNLSKVMVDSYADHYQQIGQRSTQSALETKRLVELKGLIDEFVDEIIKANDKEVAKNAKRNAQDFYYSSNKDLYHYMKLVSENTKVDSVKEKAEAVMKLLDEMIVHNRTVGSSYKNAYGVAIYIPYSSSYSYKQLKWGSESKWDNFINWINK